MKKLIIHAGLHKTGTSAIQSYLANNRELLGENSIFYPPTHTFEAHHGLASRLKSNTFSLEDKIKDVNRTLVTFSEMTDCDTILLSSEMFSESVDPRSFKYTREIFSDIEFIFYIRRQDELLESAYNQQVKQNHETRLITDYTPYFTNIHAHLEWFKDSIPDSIINAHIYDKAYLLNNDVVDDFFINILNIPKPIISKSNIDNLINKSLSPVACLIMTKINQSKVDDKTRMDIMNFLMDELPVNQFSNFKLFSDDYEEKLFNSLLESNKIIDEDYLGIKYMSSLTSRCKSHLSLNEAFTIAGDLGIIDKLKSNFGFEKLLK